MSYDTRTIAFGAEIIQQPIQLRAETVQGIYNALYQQKEIGYQNFQVAQDGIHLSNPAQSPGTISVATFLPDRVVVREEFRPCTVEEFATRIVNVTSLSYQSLEIPMSVGQQFWMRSLVNPRHVTDSREFVGQHMLSGGNEALVPFARPLHTVGVRYTFPQTETEPYILNLRIEPWTQDPRSLWLEVIGQFTQPVRTDGLPSLGDSLFKVYKFLTGPTLDYVQQFDRS